jgi:DNA-binding CsgD family transcriptional regulator
MDVAILERTGVLAAARRVLGEAVRGHGGSLFIVGEPGIGKTTVLDHVVTEASQDFRVGIGRGDVAEALLPFGLIGQALGELLGTVGVLNPQPDAPPGASAGSVLYAVLDHLRRAATQPLLVAFDDASWSDPDSLILLRLLCRRIQALPVAIIATVRPWPADALRVADELAAMGLCEVERLAPLSRDAARTLALSRASGGPLSADRRQMVDLCHGNPLLIEAVAAILRSGGPVLPAPGSAASRAWVRRVLLSELAGLDEPAERFLRAAAVLGRRFRVAVAVEVAGLDLRTAAEQLRVLSGCGLIRDAGDGWAEFTHDLVRQAVYETTAAARASLHAAAFRALATRRVHPSEAAVHVRAAGLGGEREAIGVVAAAGRDALAAGAVEAARRYLEDAVELAGQVAEPELLFDFGQALLAGGDNNTAIAVYEGLLGRSTLPPPVRLAAVRQLSRAAFHAGHIDQAVAWLDQAASDSSAVQDRDMTAALMVEHGAQVFLERGPAAALPILNRARELAVDGTPTAIAAEHVWGHTAHVSGDPRGLAAAETAAKATAVGGDPGRIQWWDARLAYAYMLKGSSRFTDAAHVFESLLGDGALKGEPMMIFQALFEWVEGLCDLGRLDEALTWSGPMTEAAELIPFARRWAAADKALVLLELGRLDEAATWCRGLTEAGNDGSYLLYVAHLPCGRLALRRGDPGQASRIFARMRELADALGIRDPCIVPWAADAITAYHACGQDADTLATVTWLEDWASGNGGEWAKITAATGRAALAERGGDLQAAEAYFRQALDLHARLGMPIALASTLTSYGAYLVRNGRPGEARPLLADAMATAESCGAAWHFQQARIQWRRAGGRSGTTPPDGLTPQEKAVAQLARDGKTNREIAAQLFLSVNTVQTHLRHAYRKLGIERRGQLVDDPHLD